MAATVAKRLFGALLPVSELSDNLEVLKLDCATRTDPNAVRYSLQPTAKSLLVGRPAVFWRRVVP